MKKKIAILDIGYGNIASVINAVDYLGFEQKLEKDPNNIKNYTHLILPGVGSFLVNSEIIHKNKWVEEIKKAANKGVYIFGICVGMQLMFTDGDEGGKTSKGLNFFSGNCKIFKNKKLKLPHIGFNEVEHSNSKIWSGILINHHSTLCILTGLNPLKTNLNVDIQYGEKFISFIEDNNILHLNFIQKKVTKLV